MAKRLNVELGFTANTSDAKKQINDLIASLQKIQTIPSNMYIDKGLQEASKAAKELQRHIQNAVNVDTGKLDLNKFANSLNKSNTNLTKLEKELSKAGSVGEDSFLRLTRSIAEADAPILKINGRLGEFITTLKNSVRWQLSSNILHGFESALSSAYGYAKDLDESLNSIRIVTGQSTDQMASFAKEANEAAKALSTTTTNYTDASLIYYQQGLSDEEVKKRTDITVKMGNVAKESAEQVSQYMTAIWENYYDGSESLESYADKITALGAATASSSKEIAGGLEKFVAVGDQIGLSYDYATAALTTILAKTRQSEDVVGTALKTIFARIQGFELGETADDGVTLNKYSEALKKVGVDVLDTNGKMKDMDTILDELAGKWGTLDSATKNALAQTVAGVRQYTQLVALMDNWDFMKENLQTVKNSSGALQEQADIFAESWEAARKRVKASLEGLYDDLIDEQGIIKLDNALADVLDILGDVIDGFGGLYGILTTIGGFIAQKFAKEMPSALESIKTALSFTTGGAQSSAQKIQAEASGIINDIAKNQAGENLSYEAEVTGLARISKMKADLAASSGTLSKAEQEEYQKRIDSTKAIYDQISATAKLVEQQRAEAEAQKQSLINRATSKINTTDTEGNTKSKAQIDQEIAEVKKLINEYVELQTTYTVIDSVRSKFGEQSNVWVNEATSVEQLQDELKKVLEIINNLNLEYKDSEGNTIQLISEESYARLEQLANGNYTGKLEELKTEIAEASAEFSAFQNGEGSNGIQGGIDQRINEIDTRIRELVNDPNIISALEKISKVFGTTSVSTEQLREVLERTNEKFKEMPTHTLKLSEALTSVAGSISMLVGTTQSISSAFDTFSDSSSTASQRITSAISVITSSLFTLNSLLTLSKNLATSFGIAANVATGGVLTVAAALGTGLVALTQHNKAEEEEIELHKKAYEASKTRAEAIEEETNEVNDLANSYKEAKKQYEDAKQNNGDLSSAHDNLLESTKSLIDKIQDETGEFKDLNEQLIIASGNYDELTAAVNKYNQDQLIKQQGADREVLQTSRQKLSDDIGSNFDSHFLSDTTTDVIEDFFPDPDEVEEYANSQGEKYSDAFYEGFINKRQNLDNEIGKKLNSISGIDARLGDNGDYFEVHLSAIKNNAESIIGIYENIDKIVSDLQEEALSSENVKDYQDLQDNGLYQGLTKWLAQNKEAYDEYTKDIEDYANTNAQLYTKQVTDNLSKEYESREEFESDQQTIIDAVVKDLEREGIAADIATDKATEAVKSVMTLSEQYKNLASEESVFDSLGEKGWDVKKLQDYYDKLDDNEKTLFLQLDFDIDDKTIENLEKQLEELKKKFSIDLDTKNVNNVTSALEAVNSNKPEDLAGIEDFFGTKLAGMKKSIVDYDDFLKQSKSDQIKYLLDVSSQLNEKLKEDTQNAISANEETISSLKEQMDKLNPNDENDAEKYNFLNQQISALEEENNTLSESLKENTINATDFIDTMSDIDKVNFMMTQSIKMTSELRQEFIDIVTSLDGMSIDDKFTLLNYALDNGIIKVEDFKEALLQLSASGEVTAESLKNVLSNDDGSIKEGFDENYSQNLLVLAKNYDTCAEEAEKYKQALASGNETMVEAAQNQLEYSIRAGESAESYDIDANRLEMLSNSYMDYAESLNGVKDGEGDAVEIAQDLALAEIRLNDAIEDLYSNWDEYKDIMDKCNDTSEEGIAIAKKEIATDAKLSKTYAALKEDVAGLLDTQSEYLSDDFIIANMNDIKAAAEGDEEALVRLRENSVIDILANSNLDEIGIDIDQVSQKINEIPDGEIDLKCNDGEFIQALVYAMQYAGYTQDQIESMLSGMGINVDLEPMEQSLNEAINASDETARKVNDALGSMGYDAEMVSDTKTTEDPKTFNGFDVNLIPQRSYGNVPAISGNSLMGYSVTQVPTEYIVYDEEISPHEETATDTKTNTTQALKVKTATKQSGGKISMANRPGGSNRNPRTSRTRSPRSSRSPRTRTRRTETFRPVREIDVEDIRHDNKKKAKDEIDRYHKINKELTNISKNLEEIAQLKDRAFGKNKLNAMKLENEELEKQAKKQQELIEETKKYLKLDRSKVEAHGAQIGEDGSIINYEALRKQKLDEYNNNIDSWAQWQKSAEDEYNAAVKAATDKYNKSKQSEVDKANFDLAKENAKEKYDQSKKDIDKYKERLDESYENFKDDISQYEDTWEQYRDAQLEEQKIKDQIYDNELEQIQYEVEIKVDLSDDSVKILEELFEQLGDDADYAADRIANLQKQTKEYVDQASIYKQGIEDIFSHAGASKDLVKKFVSGNMSSADIENLGSLGFTSDDISALRDYSDGLLELNKQYRDLRENVMDQVGQAFDDYIDKLERATDKIESLQKVTETYKNIIDIVGKKILDPTGKVTRALDEVTFKQARNLTQSTKATLDFSEKALADAKATRDELAKQYGNDNETVKLWDKKVEELEDERNSAYESWLSAWEEECQAAKDMYEDTLDSIMTNFETKMSGLAGSLDELSKAYERQTDIDEVYVDDYEKIYQLSKLSRQLNKSIDDTSQIKNKEKLKKLQQEITKAQESGVKLSQYDLDVLQKKYELELARQELEESRNAKSKVTMQRDSEGNYGYVYTADANAVADAEQNYEDKLHEYQQLNSDYIKSLQGDIIQIQQDAENAIKDFASTFQGTPEEFSKGVQAILDQYQVLMDEKYQQMGNAINNNRELYTSDWKAYSEATGYKLSIDADYLDKWEETNYSIITGFDSMNEAIEVWKNASQEAANESKEAFQSWYEQTDTALKDGGTSMDSFISDAERMATEVSGQTETIANSATSMAETFSDSFSDILSSASDFSIYYEDVIQGIIDKNTLLADSIRKVVAEATNAETMTNSGNKGNYNDGTSNDLGDSSSNDFGDTSIELINNNSSSLSSTAKETKQAVKETVKRGASSGRKANSRNTTRRLSDKEKYGIALATINGNYGWGNGSERSNKYKKKFGSNNGIQHIVDKLMAQGKVYSGAWYGAYYGITNLSKYAYSRFNTGGYTGNWIGRDGKMAILDKKEIVLNEKDTENFLSAINVVRDISKTIDLNAANASNSFAKLFAAAGIKTPQGQLQQEVHITAEFPNVSDKNEILEAFDNVINLAAQYSGRK